MSEDESAVEIDEEVSTPVVSKTKGKMDKAKWDEVRRLAEVEGVKGSELARRFDVSPSLISRFFSENEIVVGSKAKIEEIKDTAAEIAAKAISEFQAARKQRIMETKIDHYNWATLLEKQAMFLFARAKSKSEAFGTLNADLKALRQGMLLIRHGRDERLTALDAHTEIDEAQMPGISIEDLTADDLAELQNVKLDTLEDDGEPSEVIELE